MDELQEIRRRRKGKLTDVGGRRGLIELGG